ncbi:MAG: fluoride efflux transporter CrcB [Alphaproteobacteria bacterium]|nr:fluoride efflux transporter CrcB [Alphaproteobacteria bacterium]
MGFLFVFLGGGLGALGRYGVSILTRGYLLLSFPWATFIANLIGALLIGLIIAWGEKHALSLNMKLFLVTGLLGGFTTFSAFSLESAAMLQRGDYALCAIYVLASVAGTLALVFAGKFLGGLI